jgi:formylmethanofuran:tetrahydromethanopterin formyltransferase
MPAIPTLKGIVDRDIPAGVATIPELVSDGSEKISYFITFANYKKKLCEIGSLEKNAPKNLLIKFKDLGNITDRKFPIDKLPIRNENEYSILYSNLPDGVDKVYEHKIAGTQRLFYFIVKNVVSVIAITHTHFETNKNKR